MNRDLVNKLERATNKIVARIIKDCILIPTKTGGYVGNLIIEKNSLNLYNIKTLNNKILFENIIIFDFAVVISQRYNAQEFNKIKKILNIEKEFCKFHTDLIYYKESYRNAKKLKDFDRMYILEDRINLANQHAKKLRKSLSIFKK